MHHAFNINISPKSPPSPFPSFYRQISSAFVFFIHIPISFYSLAGKSPKTHISNGEKRTKKQKCSLMASWMECHYAVSLILLIVCYPSAREPGSVRLHGLKASTSKQGHQARTPSKHGDTIHVFFPPTSPADVFLLPPVFLYFFLIFFSFLH
ncbi:hypothetical protein VTN96DRAFT_7113 [Rasamsonia emersonii]